MSAALPAARPRRRLPLWCLVAALLSVAPSAFAERLGIGREQSQQHLQQALELQKAGRLDDAEQSFKRAIATDAKHTEAIRRYALLLLKRRRFGSAQQVLQQGLVQNPGDPQLEAYLAIVYCWVGQSDKALSTFKRVESHVAQPLAMQFLVAECLLYNGEHELLVRTLRDSSVGRSEQSKTKLARLLRLRYATGLLRSGKLDEAARQLGLLAKQDPRPSGLDALQAELSLRRGRCKEAVERYQKLTKRVASAALGLAESHGCLGQHRKAHALFEAYLARHKKIADMSDSTTDGSRDLPLIRSVRRAAVLDAETLVALRRYRPALKRYELAQRLGSDNSKLLLSVAKLHFQLAEYDRCLERLAPVLGEETAQAPALRLATRAALRKKDKAAALAYATRLIALDQDRGSSQAREPLAAGAYLVAAVAHKASGGYLRAIELFQRALELEPKSRSTQREYGQALLLQARRDTLTGKPQAAERRLQAAVKLAIYRQTGIPQLNLAFLALRANKPTQALDHARSAWSNNQSPLAMRAQARAHLALGQYDEAQRWYQQYKRARQRSGQTIEPPVKLELALARARAGKPAAGIALLEQQPASLSAGDAKLWRRNLNRIRLEQVDLLTRQRKWSEALKLSRTMSAQLDVFEPQERAAVLTRLLFRVLRSPTAHRAGRIRRQLAPSEIGLAFKPPYRPVSARLLSALVTLSRKDVAARRKGALDLLRIARRLPAKQRALLNGWGAATLQHVAYEQLSASQRPNKDALELLRKAARLFKQPPAVLRHNLALATHRLRGASRALSELEQVRETVPVATCNLGAFAHNRGKPREALPLLLACRRGGARYPELDRIIELKQYLFGAPSGPTAQAPTD